MTESTFWRLPSTAGFLAVLRRKTTQVVAGPSTNSGDNTHFEVVGGFQPPIERVKDFETKEAFYAILSARDRAIVFPAVMSASNIQRYEFLSEGRYWITADNLTLDEFRKEHPRLYEVWRQKIKQDSDDW